MGSNKPSGLRSGTSDKLVLEGVEELLTGGRKPAHGGLMLEWVSLR